MTNTTFTANEIAALKVIFADCLDGMGGSSWEDLENDPYTWCDAKTLVANGWSKPEAAGTFSALAAKGAIDEVEKNEWALNLTPAVRAAVNV
jgi:hypothetical protein